MEKTLPVLDYVEIEISEFCNLNCRGCCDFSNLAREKKFYDFDEYSRDMERMCELFSSIKKIRLMGGEPLLNPRLTDYCVKARSLFPDSDIRIVSNGLLIPSLEKSKLEVLKKAGIKFDISNYPPTRKKKQQITQTLKEADVPFDIGFPMDLFFRNILENPSDDPAPAFRNCIFTHCHMLGHGRLAPCSYAYCIGRFNKEFGTDYPENDYFDIYSDITGEQIIRAFSEPHTFCKCCGRGIVPIKWKGHTGTRAAKPKDWLIKDSFFNKKILPAAQSLVKPAAQKLRNYIQNEKKDRE